MNPPAQGQHDLRVGDRVVQRVIPEASRVDQVANAVALATLGQVTSRREVKQGPHQAKSHRGVGPEGGSLEMMKIDPELTAD